jgi:hypothetical protein
MSANDRRARLAAGGFRATGKTAVVPSWRAVRPDQWATPSGRLSTSHAHNVSVAKYGKIAAASEKPKENPLATIALSTIAERLLQRVDDAGELGIALAASLDRPHGVHDRGVIAPAEVAANFLE